MEFSVSSYWIPLVIDILSTVYDIVEIRRPYKYIARIGLDNKTIHQQTKYISVLVNRWRDIWPISTPVEIGIPSVEACDRFRTPVALCKSATASRVSIPGLRGGVGSTRVRVDCRRRDRPPPALRIPQQSGGRGVAVPHRRANGEWAQMG